MSFVKNFKDKVSNKVKTSLDDVIVSDIVFEERFAICKECEYLFTLSNQCKVCGCFMKAKSRLAKSECPLKKW